MTVQAIEKLQQSKTEYYYGSKLISNTFLSPSTGLYQPCCGKKKPHAIPAFSMLLNKLTSLKPLLNIFVTANNFPYDSKFDY